jgi:hypothetical protein
LHVLKCGGFGGLGGSCIVLWGVCAITRGTRSTKNSASPARRTVPFVRSGNRKYSCHLPHSTRLNPARKQGKSCSDTLRVHFVRSSADPGTKLQGSINRQGIERTYSTAGQRESGWLLDNGEVLRLSGPDGLIGAFFTRPAADESAAVFEPPPASDPARLGSP